MNPWRGLKGLPREIWVLSTATLINRAGVMALPFLVLYLTRSRGMPAEQAGLVLTLYGAGALVTAPVSGRLCDRVGSLRIMRASLFLSGAVLLVYPLARSLGTILAITILWAIVSEAFRPASMAIITDLVEPEQRKAAFALNRLAINLGLSIGPAAGGFLAMVSFPALFLVDGATSILAGAVLLLAPWRSKPHEAPSGIGSDDAPELPVRHLSILADRRLLYFLMALIPVEIVFFQSQSSMALYLVRDLQLPESVYGMLFTINTLMVVLIEVPLNTAMSGWPHRVALALGCFLCAAGFGALAWVSGVIGAAATVVVWTFGEMILLPGSSAYVADIAPPARRGEYMGLFVMTFSVAFAVGPWAGVSMLELYGPAVMWCTMFAFGCLSAGMMMRLRDRAS